jgi:hypothetical protein
MSDSVKDSVAVETKTENEVAITRHKGFSYVTYLKIFSKIIFGDTGINVETKKDWFYFIKGKPKTISVNYNEITKIEVKTVFAFWDLLFSIILLIALLAEFEIWLLVVFVIFLLCAYGKSINISLANGLKVKIPADGIGSDKALIKTIFETIQSKIPEQNTAATATSDPKEKKPEATGSVFKFLDILPFKGLAEEKIPKKVIEGNSFIKKIIPFTNLIVIGLVIIIGIFALSGESTASLEKRVLQNMRIEHDLDVVDINLVKVRKGYYTGIMKARTMFETTANYTINVVTDGRNFMWEYN